MSRIRICVKSHGNRIVRYRCARDPASGRSEDIWSVDLSVEDANRIVAEIKAAPRAAERAERERLDNALTQAKSDLMVARRRVGTLESSIAVLEARLSVAEFAEFASQPDKHNA